MSAGKIVFGKHVVHYEDLPALYRWGRTRDDSRGYPTDDIETFAEKLADESVRDVLDPRDARGLLNQICTWSGVSGNRVIASLRKMSDEVVLAAISASANYRDRFLRRSFDEMTEKFSDEAIAGIFDAFESLPGIGPTTASQVARFLLPQNAAAFNSENARFLGIPHDCNSFVAWSRACSVIAEDVNSEGIERPYVRLPEHKIKGSRPERLQWRCADIDLAIWAKEHPIT